MKRLAVIPPLALAACAPAVPVAEDFIPEYLGVQTTRLDEDLVQVDVAMTKAMSNADVERYANCAVAQYTLFQGYRFARHIRTKVNEEGGVWTADAVYTISPTRPDGLVMIDADVTVADCEATGIPTV